MMPNPQSISSSTPSWISLAQRLVLGVAVALMVFHLVVFVVYAISLAQFPFDYDQGEGFELNDTVLFSQGQWPYRDNEVFPFYASNYPPLYHLILVPLVWLFGPAYWYGRILGFLATLIAALAIAFAVQRETRHKIAALLAGLAFIASNYVYHIGPLFRQHMSMVMFETLAVVVIAGIASLPETNRKGQRRRIWATMLLLLAAGYTKQLAVATVGAVFVYLALRGLRRAILWGIGLALVAGAIFLALNVFTHGQWWLNTITANVNQYILGQYTGLLAQFVGLHGALLLLAVVFVFYELYFDRLSAYSIWFVASAANTVLAGKWGAGDSYFSTAIAAACLLAGVFLGRSLNRGWRLSPRFSVWVARWLGRLRLQMSIAFFAQRLTPFVGLAAACLFVAYGAAVLKMPLDGPIFGPLGSAFGLRSNTKFPNFYDSAGWTMGYATIGQNPSPQDTENGWKIVNLVKADPRPILSEEAAFSFATQKPVVSNPTQLLNLYNNQRYNPDALVKMIDEQAFGAVIFRARFYPQPILDAVDRRYKAIAQIPMNGYEYIVMIPR